MISTLHIQNLKCGGCAHTIKTRLEDIDGISSVDVSNDSNTVNFNYNNESELLKATELLSKLGYPVEGEINSLTKKAKSFVSCAVGRLNS